MMLLAVTPVTLTVPRAVVTVTVWVVTVGLPFMRESVCSFEYTFIVVIYITI